jgi:hypothetical protein
VGEIDALLKRIENPSGNRKPMSALQRRAHLVQTIVQKAALEQAFAEQYAEYVMRSDPVNGIRGPVVDQVSIEVDAAISNTHASDSDSFTLSATGHTKFYGALAARRAIEPEKYCDVLLVLMRRAHAYAFPALIEMLNAFVLTAGPEVVRTVADVLPEIWDLFGELLERPGLRQRLHFILVDVDEKRREWLEGVVTHVVSRTEIVVSNEAIVAVRHAFTNFIDETEIGCNLAADEFLRTALEMYPDHIRDHYLFAQFICKLLQEKKAQSLQIKDLMIDRARKCIDEGVESDCPLLWPITADLIYLMVIKGLIQYDQASAIRACFPDGRRGERWKPEEGMKWFLYDVYEFRTPAQVGEQWSQEIRDALAMPTTIENPPQSILMSRLIAIALIRAIGTRLENERSIDINSFQKWKKLLFIAFQRQRKTAFEEMGALIESLYLNLSPEDVERYCRS